VRPDVETPERSLKTQLLIDRDSELVRHLKAHYQWSCQICQESIPRSAAKPPYVEVHHVRPLGQPFNGSDVAGNMLVVCPNCHAALDLGSYGIDPQTHLVHTIDGFTRVQPLQVSHEIAQENLKFQWERFNQTRKAGS
jgi:predicted restriction endonuclease